MSDAPDFFTKPRDRLRWAREAVTEFNAIRKSFLGESKSEFRTEYDFGSGEDVYKFVLGRTELPDGLVRKANEAVEMTKRVFDQAVHAACLTANVKLRSGDNTNFPWADTISGSERILDKRNHIPKQIKSSILSLKPYGAGEDCSISEQIAKQMCTIANRGHTIGLEVVGQVYGAAMPNLVGTITLGRKGIRFPVPVWDVTKNEVELFRGPPGSAASLQNNAKVFLDIGLNEAPPLKKLSFANAMTVFANKAQYTIDTLERVSLRLRNAADG